MQPPPDYRPGGLFFATEDGASIAQQLRVIGHRGFDGCSYESNDFGHHVSRRLGPYEVTQILNCMTSNY